MTLVIYEGPAESGSFQADGNTYVAERGVAIDVPADATATLPPGWVVLHPAGDFDPAGAAATAQAAAIAASAQALVPTAVKTGAYPAVAGDFVPVDASGGSVRVTLPTAPADKTRIGVKSITAPGANSVTIAAGGGDVFNKAAGSTSLVLSAQFQGALLQYKASGGIWYVTALESPLGVASGAAKLGTDGTIGGPGGSGLTSSVVLGGSSGPPAWAASTAYAVNQLATFNGVTFLCATAHTSGTAFSATNWLRLGSSPHLPFLGLPLLPVSDRFGMIGSGSNDSTDTACDSITRWPLRRDATTVTVIVANWAGYGGATPASQVTYTAAVQDSAGNKIPVFFNGLRAVTVDGDGFAVGVATGVDALVTNGFIYVRLHATVTTVGNVLYENYATDAGLNEGRVFNSSDLTLSGTITVNSGFCVAPLTVLSPAVATDLQVLGAVGDSIVADTHGDIFGSTTSISTFSFGWPRRFAVRANRPFVNCGLSGETAQVFAAGPTSSGIYRRLALLAGCSQIVANYGINDLNTGRTLTQLQANVLTIANFFPKSKVWWGTITPYADSTDGFATLANQAHHFNVTVEGYRTTFNDWLRAGAPIDPATKVAVAVGTGGALLAGQAGHPLAGYVEIADTVETARNSGFWVSNGRSVTDAAMASTSSGIVTSATAAFTGGDVGKRVYVAGAVVSSTNGPPPTILSVQSATQATLSANATGIVSGAVMGISAYQYSLDGLHPYVEAVAAIAAAISTSALL